MIDVYIIDAKTMEYKKARIENNLETFYKLINTDSVEIITRVINGKMTQIICDEEGKLKKHQYISAVSEEHNEVLVGNLIIKSTDIEIANIIDKYGVLVYNLRKDYKSNDN